MGRLFGIPVYVSPTWFLVAALITVGFAPAVADELPDIGPWRYAVSFAFAVLLYLSVLVHELSHSVVALRFGLPVRAIRLHLLGGVSEIEREPETPWREFLVAVAGPVLSLALGGLGLGAARVLDGGTVGYLLVVQLTLANLLVGVFNLLPGLPLDGGRILRAAVWKVSGRPFTGTLVAAWAGRGVAVLVLGVPLVIAALAGRRPTLISMVWAAMVAAFIWISAGQAVQSARLRSRLPALSARRLTRRALPVAEDLPLAEALRRLDGAGGRALVTVDATGRPRALVSEAAVSATPEHRRPWVTVGSVARTIEPGLILSAELSGEDLVRRLQEAPATEYLVVEANGDVYGVLATADVERSFSLTGPG